MRQNAVMMLNPADDLIFLSSLDGHTVLRCYSHPDWHPHVQGDFFGTVAVKVRLHIEAAHVTSRTAAGSPTRC